MARPTKLDKVTVKKLEEAFVLGCTVEEACFNADISKQTYYNWTEENPELLDRFDQLKQSPILKARKTIVRALETDPKLAMKFLEKKLKYEFGNQGGQTDSRDILDVIINAFETPPIPSA